MWVRFPGRGHIMVEMTSGLSLDTPFIQGFGSSDFMQHLFRFNTSTKTGSMSVLICWLSTADRTKWQLELHHVRWEDRDYTMAKGAQLPDNCLLEPTTHLHLSRNFSAEQLFVRVVRRPWYKGENELHCVRMQMTEVYWVYSR